MKLPRIHILLNFWFGRWSFWIDTDEPPHIMKQDWERRESEQEGTAGIDFWIMLEWR